MTDRPERGWCRITWQSHERAVLRGDAPTVGLVAAALRAAGYVVEVVDGACN